MHPRTHGNTSEQGTDQPTSPSLIGAAHSHRAIPPVSSQSSPQFSDAQHKDTLARAFRDNSATYHRVRPDYPCDVLALLDHIPAGSTVLDVGAGTGKLTNQLVGQGFNVCAIDPSVEMLKTLKSHSPTIPVWAATAENPATSQRFSAIACAQTWHWVDADLALCALDEILEPGGCLFLVWNTLDVRIPWVHRLTRIMHAGDIHKPGFVPEVSPGWTISQEIRTTWTQRLTPPEIIELASTRAYWQRSSQKTRCKVQANLEWYLYENLGFGPDEGVELPYRCDAFLIERV